MSNLLTQNIVWQLHAKDLRRDMNAWSDQRLRDFATSFDHIEKRIQQAYLAEVERESQRRGTNPDLTRNS
jgi:uncharacterized protein YhjY with autotransporter beta-barrel domain